MRAFITGLSILCATAVVAQTPPASPGHVVTVEKIELTGDSRISSSQLELIERDVTRRIYRSEVAWKVVDVAEHVLRDNGYFRATVNATETQVLSTTGDKQAVSVTLRVYAGEQYHIKNVFFRNNTIFPEAQLRQAFKVEDGDVASDQEITNGKDGVRKLYASKGFLESVADVSPIVNDETRLVELLVYMEEGQQFTVNGLMLEGDREWPADKAAKLQALSQSFAGSHDVGVLIDQVKKLLAEMFPDYTQIDSLVGETMGGEQHRVTLNVRYPSESP
jgi:outer membrane protein assembly factor BamA